MGDDRAKIMHEWFDEVWNQGRVETIDRLLAEDAIVHGLADAGGEEIHGPEGFKPFYHRFRDAFPDIQIFVQDTVAEGDMIAARCEVRGTHLGDSLGMARTGRAVHFTGMVFVRVRDGKIAEAWNNFDFAVMTTQLSG